MARSTFRNLDGSGPQPFRNVIRWALLDRITRRRIRRPAGSPAPVTAAAPSLEELRRVPGPGEGIRLTWLGHASWLVQLDGVSLLLDPVLGRSLGGIVRRLGPIPIGVERLPRIDALLVTHNHRDHLDLPTLRRIDGPILAGLQMGRHFPKRACQELDWWKTARVQGVKVTFVPSQHWSNRGMFDLNRSLWGGFVIEGSGGTVYHSGDTAYFAGFREIGARFPGLAAALLPIGAYQPEWFMRRQHMNPEDAAQAFLDLGAKELFAMHWGTFQLTDEPISEPAEFLRRVWKERGLDPPRMHLLALGESRTLP